MKKLISKNWKKILIAIGVICIILNLGIKILQDTNVLSGYIANGPVIEKDIFDEISDSASNIDTTMPGSSNENTEDSTTDGEENIENDSEARTYRAALIAGGLILIILIFSSIIEGGGDKKSDKKK